MNIYSFNGISAFCNIIRFPITFTCAAENLCCYFKQITSYEKTKLKNNANRCLIFADLNGQKFCKEKGSRKELSCLTQFW